MIYSHKGYLVTAKSKHEAITKIVSSKEPFEDQLVNNRKLLVRYFNVSSGDKDSVLKIECASHDYAEKFGKFLYESEFVKKIKLESRLEFNYEIDNNFILAKFVPESDYFKSNNNSFSLSNFLYLAKDKPTALEFISKYGMVEENSTIGSYSVQALIRLCGFLKSRKSHIYVDMIEP